MYFSESHDLACEKYIRSKIFRTMQRKREFLIPCHLITWEQVNFFFTSRPLCMFLHQLYAYMYGSIRIIIHKYNIQRQCQREVAMHVTVTTAANCTLGRANKIFTNRFDNRYLLHCITQKQHYFHTLFYSMLKHVVKLQCLIIRHSILHTHIPVYKNGI